MTIQYSINYPDVHVTTIDVHLYVHFVMYVYTVSNRLFMIPYFVNFRSVEKKMCRFSLQIKSNCVGKSKQNQITLPILYSVPTREM